MNGMRVAHQSGPCNDDLLGLLCGHVRPGLSYQRSRVEESLASGTLQEMSSRHVLQSSDVGLAEPFWLLVSRRWALIFLRSS